MKYTTYNINTGEIDSYGFSSNTELFNLDAGYALLEGNPDNNYQYIQNNQFVDMPSKPGANYFFNYSTKQWDLNLDKIDSLNKSQRNNLLASSDWTQIPNSPLSVEKQNEWAVYRQQLRDITSQPGYPTDVVWPIQPE